MSPENKTILGQPSIRAIWSFYHGNKEDVLRMKIVEVCESHWALQEKFDKLEEIMHWTQAAVTALACGDIKAGSALHHKLRDLMIEYREIESLTKSA